MTAETYTISDQRSDRHPGALLASVPAPSWPGTTAVAAILLLTCSGVMPERITLCRRTLEIPYDLVIECASPEQVQQIQQILGGAVRQQLTPFDHSIVQRVVIWTDGQYFGARFRAEACYDVQHVDTP